MGGNVCVRTVRIVRAPGFTGILADDRVIRRLAIRVRRPGHRPPRSGGKVVGEGTPGDLGRSKSQWVTQFMQGLADGPVPFHYPARDYLDDLISGPLP